MKSLLRKGNFLGLKRLLELKRKFPWINLIMSRRSNYFDCKPANTPYDSNVKLFSNTKYGVKQTEYASINDSLKYATGWTRLNIANIIPLSHKIS